LAGARTQSPELTEPALSRLVRQFYAKARLDPLLGPVFETAVTDWEPHLDRVAAFWATAALGIPAYRGNPMAAHRKHALTPAMFDRWLEVWAETTAEVFAPAVAEQLTSHASLIAESLKLGLFFDPADASSLGESALTPRTRRARRSGP
jgi:hemoglobin